MELTHIQWNYQPYHVSVQSIGQFIDMCSAIDASVGWANLLRARHEVDQDPLIVAADRYATLRKFVPCPDRGA